MEFMSFFICGHLRNLWTNFLLLHFSVTSVRSVVKSGLQWLFSGRVNMRSVLIGCVVLLATGLLADGEWFPRNTVFYGKVTNGPEVEELLELPALLIPRERDREQWAMVREKLDPLIAGFESIEIAATDIIPDMDFGVKLNVILTYSTPRDPKLLENMGAKV